MCGQELLARVQTHPSLVRSVVLLGTNLPVAGGDELDFANQSGLTDFCTRYVDSIRALLSHSVDDRGFAVRLPRYCPHVFDGADVGGSQAKAAVLEYVVAQAKRNRQRESSSLARAGLIIWNAVMGRGTSANGGGLTVIVNRPRAFRDAVGELVDSQPTNVLDGIVWARFVDEPAFGVGVAREWYAEAARDLVSDETGIFTRDDNDESVNVQMREDQSAVANRTHIAVGRFLAMAVAQRQSVGVELSLAFCSKMLGLGISLADIEHDEPSLFRSLSAMRTYSNEELEDYEIPSPTGGIPVTTTNVENFIEWTVNQAILPGAEAEFEHIRNAFFDLLPRDSLTPFLTGTDLKLLIAGESRIDAEDLIRNMQLRVHWPGSETLVGWLCSVLRSMSQRDLQLFIRFVTGRARLPLGGASALSPRITIDYRGQFDGYPRAHTCFNSIDLPPYSDEDTLEEHLLGAIRQDPHMGFA